MVADAMASRWTRENGPCDAVRRWTAAVLGRPVGIRALVRAFRDYGLATGKGQGKATKGRGKRKRSGKGAGAVAEAVAVAE